LRLFVVFAIEGVQTNEPDEKASGLRALKKRLFAEADVVRLIKKRLFAGADVVRLIKKRLLV
jgi:hypothetical protein